MCRGGKEPRWAVRLAEIVVEGNESQLCEPGEPNLNLGVEGRDGEQDGTVSLVTPQRPDVDVGWTKIEALKI